MTNEERHPEGLATRLTRRGHAFAPGIVDRGALAELEDSMDAIDGVLESRLEAPGEGFLAALDDPSLTPQAKHFLLSVAKTLLDCCDPAHRIGTSDAQLEVVERYTGERRFAVLGPHMISHSPGDPEGTGFHDDALTFFEGMVICWIPVTLPLRPSQEPIVVSYSHRWGERGRRLFRRLPKALRDRIALDHGDFSAGDAYLYTGKTLHRRGVNHRSNIFLSCHYRYAALPVHASLSHSICEAGELDTSPCTTRLEPAAWERIVESELPELLDVVCRDEFDEADALSSLRLPLFAEHPVLGDRIRSILESVYQKYDGAWDRIVERGGRGPDDAGAPDPEYLTRSTVEMGLAHLQGGFEGPARACFVAARKHAASPELVDEVVGDRVTREEIDDLVATG